MKGFCEKKFSSMLVSGTFTKAVMYLMLLSDSIIAGHFIGASGVAGINAITPVTAIVTFFGDLVSTGVGIVFSREVGVMRKDRADRIYSQGLIISVGIGLLSALLILVLQNAYFKASGVTGDILENALEYYRLVPINAFLTIVIFYLEQMVYSDGDELCNNICYGFQIGGNIIPETFEDMGLVYAYDHRNEPEQPGAYRDFTFHDVLVTERESLLYRISRADVIRNAPSWHHQAVKNVAETRLTVTGITKTNGVDMIEAVERQDKTFVLGIQFHPEIAVVRSLDDTSLRFFTTIVEAAR